MNYQVTNKTNHLAHISQSNTEPFRERMLGFECLLFPTAQDGTYAFAYVYANRKRTVEGRFSDVLRTDGFFTFATQILTLR